MSTLRLEDLPEGLLFSNILCHLKNPEDVGALRLTNKYISSVTSFKKICCKTLDLKLLQKFNNCSQIDLRLVTPAQWDQEALKAILNTLPITKLTLGRHNTINASGASAIGSFGTRLCSLEVIESSISDGVLSHWKSLTRLTSLSLRDCNNITDAGLTELLPCIGHNLQEVDLGGCWQVGDGTLTELSRLPKLRKIDLTACERVTTTGLESLRASKSIKTLLLPACWQLTDESLQALTAGPHLPNQLECLGLFESGEQVTDAGLHHLTSFKNLTALDLGYSCWSHTSNGLNTSLQAFKHLKMLNIGGCEGANDATLEAIASSLKQLTMLDCSECQRISANGVEHLSKLHHLADLNLGWNLRLEDGAIAALARTGSTALTRLDLSFCGALTDKALRALAGDPSSTTTTGSGSGLPGLKVLVLRKCALITDRGLSHLVHCPLLTHIDLSYCGIGLGAAGLRHLASLPALEHLTLASSHAAVTVMGCAALAKAPLLKRLDVSDNKRFDDACMQALSLAKGLQWLNLRGCARITDHGVAALARISRLEVVKLDGCQRVTQKSVDALYTKLPRLRRIVLSTNGVVVGNTPNYRVDAAGGGGHHGANGHVQDNVPPGAFWGAPATPIGNGLYW